MKERMSVVERMKMGSGNEALALILGSTNIRSRADVTDCINLVNDREGIAKAVSELAQALVIPDGALLVSAAVLTGMMVVDAVGVPDEEMAEMPHVSDHVEEELLMAGYRPGAFSLTMSQMMAERREVQSMLLAVTVYSVVEVLAHKARAEMGRRRGEGAEAETGVEAGTESECEKCDRKEQCEAMQSVMRDIMGVGEQQAYRSQHTPFEIKVPGVKDKQ